jgi:hypothetical protein
MTVAELSNNKNMESKGIERIKALARNALFISAVGSYIAHPDPSVRRCGMLTAEVRLSSTRTMYICTLQLTISEIR